jgi:DNA polymerase-3 subunit alpha
MEDAEVQDMMSAVASGRELDDPDRSTLMNGDYSIRPSREMEELFVYAPRAYENTARIADMIDLVIEYGSYKIPTFPLSAEEESLYVEYKRFVEKHNLEQGNESYEVFGSEEWLLRTLCVDGLNTRYDFHLTDSEKSILLQKIVIEKIDRPLSSIAVEELHDIAEKSYSHEKQELLGSRTEKERDIVSRLEYELTVVNMMGFNGYFCIVADFIRYGKNHHVPVGPGRGSAAGAILAYLSGITDIDPLKYGLLFERFLNPARVTMPDIDVDFSDE